MLSIDNEDDSLKVSRISLDHQIPSLMYVKLGNLLSPFPTGEQRYKTLEKFKSNQGNQNKEDWG